MISEREIIFKLREGDKAVYEQLFLKNYKNLVLYAKKFVMDTEIARDQVQDVFIYLWDKRQNLKIEKSISSYLFRAVHNACINYLKRASTKENYINEFLININEDAYTSSFSGEAYELLVHRDLSERIESVIETLPEQCGNIFKMSRFRGLKNKEIAEIYAISPRTVEAQIYRALKILKENLKPHLTYATGLFIIMIKSFYFL